MKTQILLLVVLVIFQEVIGPPVTQKKKDEENKNEENEINDNEQLGNLGIEYNRYLKEVVTALESDPEFREKLEKAEEVDIRTGKIAQELEYVNHQVRTKLDELKRQELERLRHLAGKEYELRNGIDTEHLKIPPEHVDHSNPHTFEIEDLRKLIAKTTADLAEADKKRREEFKEYEMQKEYEKQEKLKNLDEEHKEELKKELEEKEQKHKKHEPLHHPGSKQQLEEVWEKQDHMENQEFDPKTFFYLHDLDSNGVWDEAEVKALFLKELDKLYNSGAPEDDMRERVEEMERMREHVFAEADTDKDGLISYQEFLAQTQKPDFEKDEGWDGLDQQQLYTQQEYEEFERRRQEEVQRMIAQGLIPPHPNGMPPPPGFHPGVPVQQFQHQQQHFPAQQPGQGVPHGQIHPNQLPQGQFHPGQVHPNQLPQGQIHSNQLPQGQIHPGQMPHGQVHPGQMPHGQIHPGQMPQGQVHPGQLPHGQVHPGQMPQGQVHPGQMPQGQVHPNQLSQEQHSGQVKQSQVAQGQNIPNQGHQEHQQQQAIVQQHHQAGKDLPMGQRLRQPIEQKNEPIDLNQTGEQQQHVSAQPQQ